MVNGSLCPREFVVNDQITTTSNENISTSLLHPPPDPFTYSRVSSRAHIHVFLLARTFTCLCRQTAGAHAAEKSDGADDAADGWSDLITCLQATGFGG